MSLFFMYWDISCKSTTPLVGELEPRQTQPRSLFFGEKQCFTMRSWISKESFQLLKALKIGLFKVSALSTPRFARIHRCCSVCILAIYNRNPYCNSNRQTWKSMNFSWFFEQISSPASPATLIVARECCLGHFWWKIFSSIFQLLFWSIFFAPFGWKIHAF